MNATSIVLLVGVVSFWTVAGILFALFGKTKKTLDKLEQTLEEVKIDLAQLTPVLSSTLQEIEKSGREVGKTASDVRILTERFNSSSSSTVVSGAVNYLPVAMALVKLIKPFFSKNKNSTS